MHEFSQKRVGLFVLVEWTVFVNSKSLSVRTHFHRRNILDIDLDSLAEMLH